MHRDPHTILIRKQLKQLSHVICSSPHLYDRQLLYVGEVEIVIGLQHAPKQLYSMCFLYVTKSKCEGEEEPSFCREGNSTACSLCCWIASQQQNCLSPIWSHSRSEDCVQNQEPMRHSGILVGLDLLHSSHPLITPFYSSIISRLALLISRCVDGRLENVFCTPACMTSLNVLQRQFRICLHQRAAKGSFDRLPDHRQVG